jgi:predicted amidohydrolase
MMETSAHQDTLEETPEPLARIGFFHFGTGHNLPLASLEFALAEKGRNEVAGSLIVLPEGFNIGKLYTDRGPCDSDPAIICRLGIISERYNVAFVAGLIVSDTSCVAPPYSSAYLIDRTLSVPLCRKQRRDRMHATNYTATYNSDICNPFFYRGLSISALICMDSPDKPRLEWLDVLRARTPPVAPPRQRVLCIPAHMDTSFRWDNLSSTMFGEMRVVLANSNPNGCGSLIVDSGTRVGFEQGQRNVVTLSALEECEAEASPEDAGTDLAGF